MTIWENWKLPGQWLDGAWIGGDVPSNKELEELEEARMALLGHDAEARKALLQDAVEHMGAYVALKQQIDTLEDELAETRDILIKVLFPNGAAPGVSFGFEGLGTVTGMKGRVTEKLDRAVLAKAGVDPALLDKATERKESAPMVRIELEGKRP